MTGVDEPSVFTEMHCGEAGPTLVDVCSSARRRGHRTDMGVIKTRDPIASTLSPTHQHFSGKIAQVRRRPNKKPASSKALLLALTRSHSSGRTSASTITIGHSESALFIVTRGGGLR